VHPSRYSALHVLCVDKGEDILVKKCDDSKLYLYHIVNNTLMTLLCKDFLEQTNTMNTVIHFSDSDEHHNTKQVNS